MGWLRKKKDPISEREKALRTEIDRLDAQIRDLTGQIDKSQPRLRSTALPRSQAATRTVPAPPEPPREQVFEEVDHQRLQEPPGAPSKALYNDLGVRKYDLPGAWQRLRNTFRRPEPANQPLIKLLAAGNIQGLKPLRYEKRVARLRFIVLVGVLFLLLWGIIAMFVRR